MNGSTDKPQKSIQFLDFEQKIVTLVIEILNAFLSRNFFIASHNLFIQLVTLKLFIYSVSDTKTMFFLHREDVREIKKQCLKIG